MKIDVHAHILPPDWPDLAARYGDPRWPRLDHCDACSANIIVGGEVFRHVTHQLYDVARRLEDMDAAGVTRQLLSTVPVMFSYWARPTSTLELTRHLNDHIAAISHAHPDRFLGLGTVPLNDTDLAIDELSRCMTELGLAGVEIGTNVAGVELDDPRLFDFFACAAELGAIVFVHPWQVVGGDRLAKYYFTYTVAMPSETAFALGALIFGGVLARLPDLRVLVAHGGGALPYLIGRVERGWEIWPAAREHLEVSPRSQLERCWFDSLTWDAASLELLVSRVGAERVMLGTDYPFLISEERPGELIESSGLEDPLQRSLLGGNAARFLGIAVPA
jgi:aminocarboxymuconate-semialdehyde decarboxylase